ncbi:hypothetical protein Cflav_PD6212 [Pedosphaera parvula Ellin514]|uniref:Uncharacterized protein n=1 Tax=Pedosphaera parvula (strain Ellin514) TaxID=320771 RepID=B9XHP3_PEDPL|nr:hypothetical protein Cflav_PD6212 [Pedosphaera parvula Ellin514]
MTIPTEPIDSIPRHLTLIEAVRNGNREDAGLDPLLNEAIQNTVKRSAPRWRRNYTECRKKFPNGRRDFGLRQGGGRRRYPLIATRPTTPPQIKSTLLPTTNEFPRLQDHDFLSLYFHQAYCLLSFRFFFPFRKLILAFGIIKAS